MRYQETTPEIIAKKEQDVRDYLDWIRRTDREIEESEAPLRLKPVNRTMVQFPVW